MLATVTALSPEMTFKSTPWSAKYRKVRGASRRILSLMSTSPSSRLAVEVLLALGQQQNTLPLLGVALHLLPDGGKALA